MQILPPALQPLAAYRQFILYRLVPSAKPGKTDKLPLDWRTGRMPPRNSGGHINPEYRCSFDEAAAALARGLGDGVGFVFTAEDPFFFLDADNALQADGTWSPLATDLCQRFAGAAVEVSVSGTGLHIIGTGAIPPHGCKNIPLGLEFYHEARFVALTGTHATGDASTDHSPQLSVVVPHYFPVGAALVHGPDDWTEEPVAEWDGPRDDEDLIRRAISSADRNAAVAFGASDAVTFRDLWEANADALGRKWPSPTGKDYDASQADGALAAHLAFWTGKDHERTRRLMYQSALVRDKWEMRGEYYLPRTIMRAASLTDQVCKGMSAPLPAPLAPEQITAAGMGARDAGSSGYMGVDQQIGHFRGCVYVLAENKVYTAAGHLLDAARFDATHGGYLFTVDPEGQKTTDSAWAAFTRNRVYSPPRCDLLCFRPEVPSGALINEEGRTLLNTYVPIETPRIAGDASPFLGLLAKLLPDERDRTILLTYMSSMLRNPGRKFQWWPVLQGAEGNGKTALLRCMSFGVGHRYTHLVNAQKMAKQGINFNGWVQGNLFIGVEEIYVADRRDFLEAFKPYVTNDRLPMEKKGQDEFTGDNRCNGLLLTNHPDGVPINSDGRRYAVFYTAQQYALDLSRDGMTGNYFPDLYDWLHGREAYAHLGVNYGYAVVNNYLREYEPVAEFDPARLCVRAPHTSSTAAALVASRGRAEQEIVEAIEQGRPGFANGWVSSKAIDELFDRLRINLGRPKRREMMLRLGYDYHPNLPDGRVNSTVQPDNSKPRLYIPKNHILGNITDPAEIARRYQADNSPSGAGMQSPAEKAFGR